MAGKPATTNARNDNPTNETARVLRFLLAGCVNTAATVLLYWTLLRWMAPRVAYAVSFAAGIVIGYLLNTAFVFRVRKTWRGWLAFPLVYAVSYAVGAIVLEIAIVEFELDARFAPLLSIAATVPTTYLLARMLLRGRSGPPLH
ncbi:MAG: GtrA family protein [Luteimonas sp.]